jgi:hypothetical protein
MIIDLVPRVRKALAVSSSYEDTDIPDLISETINRLLRDYHFPKAVAKASFNGALLGDREFVLPAGFKKELEVRYQDPSDGSYSDPLRKREGFQLPYPSGVPYYYWLEGNKLVVDTPYPQSMVGFNTFVWYESMDVASNEAWITADFAAAVRLFSIVRGAAEFRKPEVAQVYGALWQDEQASLAIYLNELEWNNAQINMREARSVPRERYPA